MKDNSTRKQVAAYLAKLMNPHLSKALGYSNRPAAIDWKYVL